ncbi:hypothetical protein ACFQBQ_18160 [Granulicella cerasi]|uniref:Uncharacterized protein n=1 Tax=Granulicella cerasi TaxID=741063 RepID=A0ABW1ZEP2_9BACT|nr:hypothetical protein [Granulicella cerasi]
MTRLELLKIAVGRARINGFEFRRWYSQRLGVPWISAEASLALLDTQRRYYAMLFSHEFAQAFWKSGSELTLEIPSGSFQRKGPNGTIITVTRKPYTKRTMRPDAWEYHLKQMALQEEPLRYLRRFLAIEDELEDELEAATAAHVKPAAKKSASADRRKKPLARPLPTGKPKFLERPYGG